MNSDGSFTVILRITDPARPLIEICLNVDTSASAKSIHDKWQDKAPQVYAAFHELMLD
ncbi:MAG: DUF4364 family protein [Clostridiales bacterium]|nr:DUF4364 family protein [Clostridiales bacterium]